MSAPLNIPDIPASVTVTNQLSRMVRIPGVRDIPANATVTIPLVNKSALSEARRLRRWRNIKRAVTASVLAYVSANAAWGTVKATNLTGVVQSLGGLIAPLTANEVRTVDLTTYVTVSQRIRIWRALTNAAKGSVISIIAFPQISSISPATSDLAGIAVTIRGAYFAAGATVTIGGVSCTGVTVVNSTTITCTAPVGTAGAKDVVVTNATNYAATLTAAFTYTAVTFGSVAPATGTHLGGTPITVTGTNFVTGTTVKIGGVLATSVVIVSSTTITAVTPAGSAGADDVLITAPGTGGSTATGTGAFTYT